MNILLTGANGFIGQAIYKALEDTCCITPSVRKLMPKDQDFKILDLSTRSGWDDALVDKSVVIHCAARAHVLNESLESPHLIYEKINVEGTRELARHAARNGVKRFVFLSSINVLGKSTELGMPFFSSGLVNAKDEFSVSKLKAEEALKAICAETGMEYVIIRPPLVYGSGVKANFLSMLKWIARGVPLPLGAIRHNKRSLVYVENLVDLIKVCIEHPAGANQTFLVSDDEDVSTCELLERVAKALGVKSRLLPIPPSWLGFAGKLLGKKDIEQRLCGSLQVNIEHTKNTLGWKPPYSMEQGLARTAEWYKNRS
ncbi:MULTISPECIES: SDR family oxidoreductase [unclassified Marinobacterium]|uniref:UDP-glucose 4-epimerase family protein n=1 Tax=unclassified Marinobacterium TaxID=2644139 RepID=UPI001568BAB9|nr:MULTISPECIES: SDR family oxidoreductase [unclassified Marinobacterium]NRP53642.1 dTDP-glucose 4,6-dehydratase [Marinobacterium sp. xm-v-242]NRP77892.1 dTDP-glucose 4,6-dehydratase [Marinobacterium sp. xm-m-383]